MKPPRDAQWDIIEALERRDLIRVINLTKQWDWDWNMLAKSAASIGDTEMTLYFMGMGGNDIYGIMHSAKVNDHNDLYMILKNISVYK